MSFSLLRHQSRRIYITTRLVLKEMKNRKKMQASSAHHSHAKALCSFAFAAQTDALAAASTYTDIMIEVQRAFSLFTFATKDSSL
jgi:hypothetical protein